MIANFALRSLLITHLLCLCIECIISKDITDKSESREATDGHPNTNISTVTESIDSQSTYTTPLTHQPTMPFLLSTNSSEFFVSSTHLNNNSKKHQSVYKEPIWEAKNNSVTKENLNFLNRTDSSVKFLKYHTGETIRLRCRISKGSSLVLWNKVGLDYPLTIGMSRFTPDERVNVKFKAPDRWTLTITKAKLADSGVYTCDTGVSISSNNASVPTGKTEIQSNMNHKVKVTGYTDQRDNERKSIRQSRGRRKKFKNRDYYVSVVEPIPSERYQVDAPAEERIVRANKTITVTGPKLVFYGTPLELICRAKFSSDEAKLDPNISLEWYHRGVRRRPNPFRSGGVYITEKWIDSHLLESRLLISWASEADAGQWTCLDRSTAPLNRSPTLQHRIGKEMVNSENMDLTKNTIGNVFVPNVISQTDIIYDRIDIEIIDLPDPTALITRPHVTTPSMIPAYVPSPTGLSSQLKAQRSDKRPLRAAGLHSAHWQTAMGSWRFSSRNSSLKLQYRTVETYFLLLLTFVIEWVQYKQFQ